MVEITLFEIQLPDAEFNAPFSSRGGDDRASDAGLGSSSRDVLEAFDSSGETGAIGSALAVAGVVAFALLRRRADRGRGRPISIAGLE